MSNKKKILLLAIGLLVIIGILFLITVLTSDGIKVPEDLTSPSQPITQPLPESKINIDEIPETADKLVAGDVEVNNFYKSAQLVNDNGDAMISRSDEFEILYMPTGAQFLISIIGSPFEESKRLAETSFLQSLGISQNQACQLNVIVTTPRFANPDQAGQEYKLSFCE